MDRAIAREGTFKIVILVRLSAIFPFLFMNYAFGLTGIGTLQYVGATFVGILPATVAFASPAARHEGAAVGTESSPKTIITSPAGVIAIIVSDLRRPRCCTRDKTRGS